MTKFMKKLTGLALGLALITGVGVGVSATQKESVEVNATPQLGYTLNTSVAGTASGYSDNCDITVNSIDWNVTGNSTMSPWRLGGKKITTVVRRIYSKDPIAKDINKIEVNYGATSGSITVNSAKLNVYSTAALASAGATGDKASFDLTFSANDSQTIEKADTTSWLNCYYSFDFNLTNTNKDNKYISLGNCLFYYDESGATLNKIEVTTMPTKTQYTVGENLNTSGIVVTGTYSDSSTENVTSGCTFSPNVVSNAGDNTITVTHTKSGKTTSFVVVGNAYSSKTYRKVTTAPADWRGTYLFVYEDGENSYVLNSSLSTLDVTYNTVSAEIDSDTIISDLSIDNAAVQIVRRDIDGVSTYQVLCANGKYLCSGSKTISSSESYSQSSSASFVTVDDNLSLKIDNYYLRFNIASNQLRFRFGTTDYLKTTAIYKLDTSTTETNANTFGGAFMTSVGGVCDPTGAVDNITSEIWNAQKTAFDDLDIDTQGYLACLTGNETGSNAEKAVRLYDYIIGKYGSSKHTDFMNRIDSGKIVTPRYNVINGSNSDTTIAIVAVISLIGVSAIGGYFFIRKTKHE